MRFPLVRSGDNDSPIAWWEWLFAPLLMPLFLVLLLLMVVVSVPIELGRQLVMYRREKQLPKRLAEHGHFLDWPDLKRRLEAGEGTLIVEHCALHGPIREWWTEDDVIASAPAALPKSIRSLGDELEVLRDFSRTCAGKYVDLASGTAKLTVVRGSILKKLNPAKYVVVDIGGGWMTALFLPTAGRQLRDLYPRAKVVSLFTSFDEPLLLEGDLEDTLLGD
ncbi:MAG TPA: hypothetical protein VKD72_34820 [Gemmataceae bacterium]|nr:hypothetical protein [Gemmataceae bacterium]